MIAAVSAQPIISESIAYNNSFYDIIDKEETIAEGKDMMYQFKKNWKASKASNGGVTSTTFDVFFAIVRSIAPTMEDLKKNQAGLFEECRINNEFFCFTTLPSIAKIMNNLHNYKEMQVCNKTVYNQIQRLIDIGIITQKVNYKVTGKRNPYPGEEDPKGRGKIQLWISPNVLKFKKFDKAGSPIFLDSNRNFLPQYEQSSLHNISEELKLIDNTLEPVEKAVSAIAELNSSDIIGKEQGSKESPPPFPNISQKNFTEKDFVLEQIWRLAQYNLWDGYSFNFQTVAASKQIIAQMLNIAQDEVSEYRKKRLFEFKQNPAYILSTGQAKQEKLEKKFMSTLPLAEQAAIEIVSHAILKQRKYSEKHGSLDKIFYPVDYFTSKSAVTALQYSIQDWHSITQKYFSKNKNSEAYFEQVGWIMNRYSATLREIFKDGKQNAYNNLMRKYQEWTQGLSINIYLTPELITRLKTDFTNKLKPLFL